MKKNLAKSIGIKKEDSKKEDKKEDNKKEEKKVTTTTKVKPATGTGPKKEDKK